MTEITADADTAFHRDRAPCKRCGESIETDVPACPHCGNQPAALVKWGSVVAMFVGTTLAVSASHLIVTYWPGSIVGIALFCCGLGLYWVLTDRYSPTRYDASARASGAESGPVNP